MVMEPETAAGAEDAALLLEQTGLDPLGRRRQLMRRHPPGREAIERADQREGGPGDDVVGDDQPDPVSILFPQIFIQFLF